MYFSKRFSISFLFCLTSLSYSLSMYSIYFLQSLKLERFIAAAFFLGRPSTTLGSDTYRLFLCSTRTQNSSLLYLPTTHLSWMSCCMSSYSWVECQCSFVRSTMFHVLKPKLEEQYTNFVLSHINAMTPLPGSKILVYKWPV